MVANNPDELEKAREELEYHEALASAYSYLGFRSRTAAEVRKKLVEKAYSLPTVESVLRHLQAEGYINDREYAERLAETAPLRRIGRGRVAAEIRRRGIAPDLLKEAMLNFSDKQEIETAVAFAVQRSASMEGIDVATRNRRLMGALQRRGFTWSAARSALQQLSENDERTED
jgi:regulatory protein